MLLLCQQPVYILLISESISRQASKHLFSAFLTCSGALVAVDHNDVALLVVYSNVVVVQGNHRMNVSYICYDVVGFDWRFRDSDL